MAAIPKVNPEKCPACEQPIVGMYGSGECWHDVCWKTHRAAIGEGRCNQHALCAKENKRVKDELRKEFDERQEARRMATLVKFQEGGVVRLNDL